MNSGILPTTAMNNRRLGALSGCERKAHGGTQGQNLDGRSVARHRPNGGFSFVPPYEIFLRSRSCDSSQAQAPRVVFEAGFGPPRDVDPLHQMSVWVAWRSVCVPLDQPSGLDEAL